MRIISITICFLLVTFCSLNSKNNGETKRLTEQPTVYPSPSPGYRRDSLYIAYTVREFMEKGVDIFDFYKRNNIPLTNVSINIDTILYSSDSLKLFSFVIVGDLDRNNAKSDVYFYSGSNFIGFRDNKSCPWSIWFFGQYRPTGFKNYNKVRELFRNYYFGEGEFKDDYSTYWDGKHNDTLGMARSITVPNEPNRVNIKFGYNLDDPRFWDSSIVWKKGSRIPGYYAFQTIGNVAPGYGDSLIKKMPQLDYPDSLLQMYK